MGVPGSPPRARGRPPVPTRAVCANRFTPARAGTAPAPALAHSRRTVHPRARGDGLNKNRSSGKSPGSPPRARGRRVPRSEPGRASGSPPRARGRQDAQRLTPHVGRFTPARAGTAPPGPWRRCPRPVHPRARGDGSTGTTRRAAGLGSPPRARGRLVDDHLRTRLGRFTPARAGTAPPGHTCAGNTPVHPRARGDGAAGMTLEDTLGGSPPRARGRQCGATLRGRGIRFTPARAGTATRHRAGQPAPAVHPRARGDGGTRSWRTSQGTGSPPRARGRLPKRPHCPSISRFTPARAGTATMMRRGLIRATVHPRARGDGWGCWASASEGRGSPPRARGRQPVASCADQLGRFTPARAGTAPPPRRGRRGCSVHPRARGDGAQQKRLGILTRGSPPRARGRQRREGLQVGEERFTPARAGTAPSGTASRPASAVHPRARGDGHDNRDDLHEQAGSPPRARGRRLAIQR